MKNVRLTDGTIVNNIPDDWSKETFQKKALQNGITPEQLGMSPTQAASLLSGDNSEADAKNIMNELDIANAAIVPQPVHSNNPYVQGMIDTNTALDKGITTPSEKHNVSPLLYSLVGTRDTAGKDNVFGYLSPYTKDTKLTPDDIKDIKDITGAGNFGLDFAAFAVPEAAAGEFLGGAIGADVVANTPKAVKAAAATTRFLAPKAIGSLSAQASHGDITGEQTGIDLAILSAGDLILGGMAGASESQVKDAFNKLLESGRDNPELRNNTRLYLAYSRLQELGEHLQSLREVNNTATLDDAIEAMKQEVPDTFEGQQWEDLQDIIDNEGFDGDSSSIIIDTAKNNKNGYLAKARTLAKSEQERKALRVLAEANEAYRKTWLGKLRVLPMHIPDEIMPRTPSQKLTGVAADWVGFKRLPFIESKLMEKNAITVTEEERKGLIKDLQADNRRIKNDLRDIGNKKGVSLNKKYYALERQQKLNNQIIDYLKSDMKGRAKKIQPIQVAIKEAQEEDFNTGKYENLMKRFSDLQSKYEYMNLSKTDKEINTLQKVATELGHGKSLSINGILATIGLKIAFGKIIATTTLAEKLSQNIRSSVLSEALKLANMVEKGDITKEEASLLIRKRMQKAKQLTRVADSGVRLFNNQNKDDKE
ncbi:hypothetical protein E9863_07320 [Salmonella enterica]|uniref:hypothetical protein n=1 Tax=Salmonella enterica TaxID=28901 RepID=UPI0009AFE9FC|nr:hypothetical protein [Salmonella enterica]EAV6171061.1 hypothetical protein [Salmonella enterica subsp. enterica serovar Havana]